MKNNNNNKKIFLPSVLFFILLIGVFVSNNSNTALAVERLDKNDFDCKFIKSSKSKKGLTLCLQKVNMTLGQDMVMGQYILGDDNVMIRITDDMDANRERILHELFHYVTTKYASVYSSKELVKYEIQEDMAYEITYLFSESNKILKSYQK